MRSRAAIFVAALLLAAHGAGARPARALAPDAALEARIARIARRVPGRVGVSAVLLESGRSAGFRDREPCVLQSTFKVFVAATTLAAIDRGALRLDTLVPLRVRDMLPGVSALTDAHPRGGVSVPVHELLESMLVHSDNTAADVLLDQIGGPAAVTAWLAGQGVDDIRVDRGERQLNDDWYGLVSRLPAEQWTADTLGALRNAVPARVRDAAAAAFVRDPRDHGSPAGFTRVLGLVQRRSALSGAACDTLLAMMGRCATGSARLPAGLPKQARIAHKTGTGGTWRGRTNAVNDAGILTLPGGGGHVAIAVLVTDLKGPVPVAERAIADIARAVFDAWNAPE